MRHVWFVFIHFSRHFVGRIRYVMFTEKNALSGGGCYEVRE